MIKLKDLLFETVAHTQKSLQWVAYNFIPMYPKIMKQIMGDVPITTFHNLDWHSVKNKLPKVIGSKKSVSSYTALQKNTNMTKGGGVQTKGGIVLELEGKVLIAGTEDLGSVPDESGRRWIAPSYFGNITGMKQFTLDGGGFYFKKSLYKYDKKLEDILWRYNTSLLTMNAEEQQKFPLYSGKQKADLIKRYIDASNKFLLANKKKIKDTFTKNINNPKVKNDRFTYEWNELLVYDIKVKDAYIVLDYVGDPNDYEATEKTLKQIKKDLKPFVKGKIHQGFTDGVKKFVNQRGGKIWYT